MSDKKKETPKDTPTTSAKDRAITHLHHALVSLNSTFPARAKEHVAKAIAELRKGG